MQSLGGRRAGDPSVRLVPGSLLAFHFFFFFFSPSSSEGFFILKYNFFPSLLFPTLIQTATVEKGMYLHQTEQTGRRDGGAAPVPQPGPRAFPRLPGEL